MASNSERIQEHTSRIEDVVNQIITAGGFVFVDTEQNIKGIKTFSEMVGIANVDGTTDYLKHINNNFLISTSTGTNLLNIDEGLNKIYAFNKELAFKDDLIDAGGGTTVTVGSSAVDSLSFDSDPQAQITSISNRVKPALVNVSHNENTGEFTFTRDNGTSFVVDTLLEKVVTNFTYNENTQNLELKLEDGTIKYIPMTAFIDDYSGTDGAVIAVSVSNDNKISAVVKNGTITKAHLAETVQATLDEVGSNAGKIDTILNNWTDVEGDIDKVTQELNLLKKYADFVEEQKQKSKNLFNIDGIRYGKSLSANAGEMANNGNYFVSNDMVVAGLSNIVMSGGVGSSDYLMFYDANFVWDGTIHRISDNAVFQVPSNAVYCRFECKLTNINNPIQVEEGTTPTDYQPYYGKIVHAKDLNNLKNYVVGEFAVVTNKSTTQWSNNGLDVIQKFANGDLKITDSDFICTKAGKYLIYADGAIKYDGGGTCGLVLGLNHSTTIKQSNTTNGRDGSIIKHIVCGVFDLQVGDVIDFSFYTDSASTISTTANGSAILIMEM